MTKIYLVRHGQTEWNKDLTFRGRKDVPLNEQGRKEASAIAETLKDKGIKAIYTSPLARSVETAGPLAEHLELEIITLQGFIDLNFGDWEGLSFSEVRKRYSDQYEAWENRPESVRFPSGETLDEARERAFSAFNSIIDKNPEKTLLAIPHRIINKLILCAVLGLSNSHFWKIKQDTGCINLIEHGEGGFVLSLMNDTCHLRGLKGRSSQPDF